MNEKCWYKKEKENTDYYCLSPNYEVKYSTPPSASITKVDENIVIKELNDIRKEWDLLPRQDLQKYGNTNIYYADVKVEEDKVELPAGTYYFSPGAGFSDVPDRLITHSFRTDTYLDIFEKTAEIKEQITKFLDNKELYKELNCIHKFSMLMYGPPGDGKTSLCRHLINTDPKFKDAIVISIDEDLPCISFLQTLDKSTKGKLKVFILEEITNLATTSESTRQLLTFLDGEHSIDNCIIISTTNYPELLPKNIVERPSRIDKLYKVGSPNREEAKQLIKHYYKAEADEDILNDIVGNSSAFIKEICLNALLNNISLSESLNRVKNMFKVVQHDFSDKKLGL